MPRTQCCAANCHNRGGFRFPTYIGLRKVWEEKVQRTDWRASKSSVLCADHFDTNDILLTSSTGLELLRRRLKKGAVPKYLGFSKKDVLSPRLSNHTDQSLPCAPKSSTQAGTNTCCRRSPRTTTQHQHTQGNPKWYEPSVGPHEDMDPHDFITIKEERLWEQDMVMDSKPQPVQELYIKKEPPSTEESHQVDGRQPLNTVEDHQVDGWAAVKEEPSGHKSSSCTWVKRETETDECEPMFGFVDVYALLPRLPLHAQISDNIDPLQLLQESPVTPRKQRKTPVAAQASELACPTCGRTCGSVASLRKHVWLHTATKSHKCLECGAAFARPDYLVKHMTTHSGERRWACGHCDKTFTRNSSLAKHAQTHLQARPFSCDQCELSFTHRHQLARHLRSLRKTPH